jgi:hypothetical protein
MDTIIGEKMIRTGKAGGIGLCPEIHSKKSRDLPALDKKIHLHFMPLVLKRCQ